MVLLLMVRVQEELMVFSMTIPPPSAVVVLWVTTMLVRVTLWFPWSRMPPPVALGPSGLAASDTAPFWIVKPRKVTRNLVAGLLVSLGLMSKTRARWLPSTMTAAP